MDDDGVDRAHDPLLMKGVEQCETEPDPRMAACNPSRRGMQSRSDGLIASPVEGVDVLCCRFCASSLRL
jgi:hypothetical protein